MRGCLLLLVLGVFTLIMAGTHGEEDVFGKNERGVRENILDREFRAVKKITKVIKRNPNKSSHNIQKKRNTNTKNARSKGKSVGKEKLSKKYAIKTQSSKIPEKKKTPDKNSRKKGKQLLLHKNKNGKQPPNLSKTKHTEVPTSSHGRQINAWESCDVNTVNSTCLQNALDSMEFEKKQMQSFYKQQSRAKNHNKTIGGKLSKKGEFSSAAALMLDALGGNIRNLSCNSNSTSAKTLDAVDNYNLLNNCSASIEEACTMPNETYNPTMKAKMDECAIIFDTAKKISDDCRSSRINMENGTNACICWANAAKGIKAAKKAGCKAAIIAKNVKKQKTKCLAAFGVCKRAEDSAAALIYNCSPGDIKEGVTVEPPINGTAGRRSYLAGLAYEFDASKSPFCAGTLVSSRWVVTSASCSYSDTAKVGSDKVSVVLGEEHVETDSQYYKVVNVDLILVHSGYSNGDTSDNIALWRLSEEVDREIYSVACLPAQDATPTGTAQLVGWRISQHVGYLSETLQERDLEIMSNCQEGNTVLCTSPDSGDNCQGDEGGPLLQGDNILVGAVSGIQGCSASPNQGIFTRISKYSDWIKTKIANNGGGDVCGE